MKKKTISVLLSAAMAAGMLASPVFAAENEIYMFINQPEYADAINELIDAYKEVAPDVTINYESTQNDYPTLLKSKLNSGDVPDIFASTSGKEIDVYREYSYDLSDQPLAETILPSVASAMASTEEGGGLYGIAIKGNYFGLVYNKGIFEEVGIDVPQTVEELKAACAALSEAGYTPFTTGYAEWWVFKHIFQHYLAAAADGAGTTVAELVQQFEKGEVSIADLPEIYDNFFDLIDLSLEYGDDKPLETDLSGELAAYGSGTAAMVLGQGAWIEADSLAIDPDLQVGFSGYPVTDDAAQCQIISGSDQALHVSNSSEALQATLDFVNWWYTSDYGISWFTDVAGVVPPVATDAESEFEVIKQGSALEAEKGSAPLGVCYSTDSWWQKFGELMQDYIAGTADKDATCAAIEENWAAIDGAQ